VSVGEGPVTQFPRRDTRALVVQFPILLLLSFGASSGFNELLIRASAWRALGSRCDSNCDFGAAAWRALRELPVIPSLPQILLRPSFLPEEVLQASPSYHTRY
jgi:hypothetical protein